MTANDAVRRPEDEAAAGAVIDEDAPARGVIDEDDPNPPEPNEPA